MILPSATIWPDMVQGSEQWFAARAGRATASRFGKILTPGGKLSAQATDLARILARECIMTDPQEFAGNRFTDWGTEHELDARDAFETETDLRVDQVGFCTNSANPVLGCSPDGLIRGVSGYTAGLEIKCPAIDTLVDWLVNCGGKIPSQYMPQVHGSMIVTGLRKWEFCGFHPGAPLYLATATWDSYTDKLTAALDEFVILYAGIRRDVLKAMGKAES